MPSTSNQPPKPPLWVVLLLGVILVPKWFLLTRRAARANRRADSWIAKASRERGVRVLNTLDFPPSTPDPPERARKPEVERLLGKHVPRYYDHMTVRQLWNRRFSNVLWQHPKDQIYTTRLHPLHNPPRTPFEVDHNGGRFVFKTSGLEHFLTYLLDPVLQLSTEELSKCFSYGYTSLWVLEHGRTFFPTRDAVPTIPPRQAHDRKVGDGLWAVLSDPQLSPSRGLNAFSIVLGRRASETAASAQAEEFAHKHGIAACIARIVEDRYWH